MQAILRSSLSVLAELQTANLDDDVHISAVPCVFNFVELLHDLLPHCA